MYVKEYHVIKRKKLLFPESVAARDDFVTDKGVSVDFLKIWEESFLYLSPYCIDTKHKEVVFVRVNPELEIESAFPFFYHAQRLHAVKIYRLEFQQFYDLANSLPENSTNIAFLFSTGRCGSTLFGKLMEASPDIQSISEPDIYTQAVLNHDFPVEEITTLLGAHTRILVHIFRCRRPERPFVLIKLRSQCTYIADVFNYAIPGAKRIYLYRNGLDVFSSFYSLIPVFIRHLINYIPFDRWLFSFPSVNQLINKMCPVLSKPGFNSMPLSGFNVLALMWLSNLEKAAGLEEDSPGFFDAKLRYEDLVENPVSQISIITQAFDLAMPEREAVEKTLKKNSQTGSRLQSQGSHHLTSAEIEKFHQLISRHPTIHNSDYRL